MAKTALGRGLGALLPDDAEQTPRPAGTAAVFPGMGGALQNAAAQPERGGEVSVPIGRIQANPQQPRHRFDESALAELAASIKQHGIIEPVIVDEGPEGYVIIAGERRVRAAQIAGLAEVPVIIRNYTSEERLEVALIENIHREDLNPVEEALAYKRIMESAGLSQDEAAARIGKSRSTVANSLRLLRLPETMRSSLEDGSLSAGHARAILSLPREADQERLYREISEKGLSVRAAEQRAAELAGKTRVSPVSAERGAGEDRRDPHVKAMEERFIEKLGTKVSISGGLSKGRIEIEYYSMDDLDRLYQLLG
jgi:ParB family chromosome partitioning protein